MSVLGGSILIVGSLQTNASTLNCNVSGCTNINAFDVYLAGLGGAAGTIIPNVDEFGWSGYVLSDFGSGAPSITNSTFTDYVILTLQSYKNVGGTTINPQGLAADYEISLAVELTGHITDGATGAFAFDGVNDISMYYDLGTPNGDFLTNLNGFLDGTEVVTETGSLVSLTTAPSPVPNTGILEASLGASGEFNFQAGIDTPTGEDFLREAGTTNLLTDVYNVYSLTAAEVTFQCQQIVGTGLSCNTDLGTYGTIFGNFEAIYGPFANATLQTFVSTSPDTNLATAVPEPSTLLLISVAMLGLGATRRKIKMSS